MPSPAFPLAQVRTHHGVPTISLEDRPVFPLLLMTGPRAIADLHQLGPCPIHLLTESFELGWAGVGRFDPAPFDDKARALLRADPEAWLLPRLMLDAPADWLEAHPDDVTGYADPASWQDTMSWYGPRHPSWASPRWRQDAGDVLQKLIRHAATQEYAGRIIGWHIGSGIYGE